MPPASGDAGGAIGSALFQYFKIKKTKHFHLNNPYLGPEFSNSKIKKLIVNKKLDLNKFSIKEFADTDLIKFIASKISESKVIGWFPRQDGVWP